MTSIVGANIGANIIRAETVVFMEEHLQVVSIFIGLILALFPDAWIQFFTDDESI